MKLLLQFSLIIVLSASVFGATRSEFNRISPSANLRVVGNDEILSAVKLLVSRRVSRRDSMLQSGKRLTVTLKTDKVPIFAELRQFRSGGKSVISAKVKTDMKITTRASGPGSGSGAALSPMTLSICIGGGPSIPIITGPPFLCLCEYGCGTFFGFKYCYIICGGILTLVASPDPTFNCSVSGISLGGPDFCPLPTSTEICSAFWFSCLHAWNYVGVLIVKGTLHYLCRLSK